MIEKAKSMMMFQSALLSLLHYEFSYTFPYLPFIINCCLLFIILKGRRGIGPAHLLPTTLFVTTCRHTIHLPQCTYISKNYHMHTLIFFIFFTQPQVFISLQPFTHHAFRHNFPTHNPSSPLYINKYYHINIK